MALSIKIDTGEGRVIQRAKEPITIGYRVEIVVGVLWGYQGAVTDIYDNLCIVDLDNRGGLLCLELSHLKKI